MRIYRGRAKTHRRYLAPVVGYDLGKPKIAGVANGGYFALYIYTI